MSYTKHVEYRFEVEDEGLSTDGICHQEAHGRDVIWVEETRKNGQEDCHMQGMLVRYPGKPWEWDEHDDGSSFKFYGSQELRDGIPAYLNANPFPEEPTP